MRKDTVKNLFLVLSVFTAFILIYQIWFSGYFLPDGGDYVASGFKNYVLSPLKNFFSKDGNADFSQNLNALLQPEKIVINVSGERRVFNNGTEGFASGTAFASGIFESFLSGDAKLMNRETVTLDAYTSALRSKSIYVDYGKTCDFRLLSFAVSGYNKNHYTTDLSAVRGYILNLHDSILNRVTVFVKDEKTGNIYKYVIETEDDIYQERLQELIDESPMDSVASYSFELNFHKAPAEQETKVIFDPLILMELTAKNMNHVQGYSLMGFDQDLNYDHEDQILNLFSINSRSIWKYTDLNNTKVFIENNATLTLHPGGKIEYETVQGGRGLDIASHTDRTDYDIFEAATDAVDFVADLSACFPTEFFEHLQIVSDFTETANQNIYTIYFDYCLEGVPVLHQTESGAVHTVEMVIESGYLKSYKQYAKMYAYEKTEPARVLSPIINATDGLVDTLYTGTEPLDITKVSSCYVDTGNGVLPYWKVCVNGEDRITE